MKLLIVYPNMGLEMTLNHGITALAASAKAAGHEVDLLYLATYRPAHDLRTISKACPDVVAISLTENHRAQMEHLASAVRAQHPETKIFAGGPFPSAYREWLEECDALDGIGFGEGELPLVAVLDALARNADYTRIRGFWFRDGGRIIRNEPHPIADDLDALPLPDLTVFDKRTILN